MDELRSFMRTKKQEEAYDFSRGRFTYLKKHTTISKRMVIMTHQDLKEILKNNKHVTKEKFLILCKYIDDCEKKGISAVDVLRVIRDSGFIIG